MQTKITRKPGQKGTKELAAKYGDKLICVRYRHDLEKRKRYKTVELIVEESDWMPEDVVVLVKVEWGERDLAIKIKQEGGNFDKVKKAWELPYKKVVELGLQNRMIREWEEKHE